MKQYIFITIIFICTIDPIFAKERDLDIYDFSNRAEEMCKEPQLYGYVQTTKGDANIDIALLIKRSTCKFCNLIWSYNDLPDLCLDKSSMKIWHSEPKFFISADKSFSLLSLLDVAVIIKFAPLLASSSAIA